MFDFTIRPDGAEAYQIKAETRDVLVWEKAGRGRSLETLTNTLSMAALYEVSHIAARRQGKYHGSLAEWESSVNIDFDVEDEPDPTPPAASPGELSN